MTTYVITRKSDGQEVYRYAAEEPIEWQGMEFATHDHTAIPETSIDPVSSPTVYGGRRDLTVLEFMRLFTPIERITIREAAKISPMAEDYLDLMYHADAVHLDDPTLIAALGMFEQGGVISKGRAKEVLNG